MTDHTVRPYQPEQRSSAQPNVDNRFRSTKIMGTVRVGGVPETMPMYIGNPIGSIHSLYLVGEIEGPESFADWFHVIRMAQPEDQIKIHINSPGGQLWTAIQLLRALNECKGTVIISVEGECASAATIPMMCGDMIEIANHSMFMFHNYSGATIGKGGEMYAQVDHMRKWSRALLEEVYKDFLTADEITRILANEDLYMDGDEVADRLQYRVTKIQERMDQQKGSSEAKQYDCCSEDPTGEQPCECGE